MSRIRIGDYFKNDNISRSARDWKEIDRIRNAINSFDDESDIQKWIYERRQSSFNRYEDKRLFGIEINDEIDEFGVHKTNKYFDERLSNVNGNNQNDGKKLDYFKRDIRGNQRYNRDGSPKEFGKFGQGMINFANNTLDSNIGKIASFTIKNFKAILIIFLILLFALVAIIGVIYVTGSLTSIGHTPFVLCGQDEITGGAITQLPNAQVSEMATPEYASKAFISVAKGKGWKDEAIVGTLSYILQEGSGMGTFTYEGYYSWNGPSNVLFDKTLNNKMWLDWLKTSGKEQAHSGYYSKNTTWYAAMGLGLLQESDVWKYDGSMDDVGATNLINYAESKGKPWQDPETQMNYFFEHIFSKSNAFDTSRIDPTKDNLSAEEWCRRVSAGVGMPSYSWTDNNQYMLDHIRHIDEANKMLRDFTGVSMGHLNQQIKNPCGNANAIISGGNETIADAAVTLASGDGNQNKILWDMDGADSINLNDQRLKTYKMMHMEIFQNDQHFASCDRGAATAIRWSGADKTFPAGDTSVQYNYLKSSDKWSYVGDYGSVELKPGDALITKGNGHIKIYVGTEAANKRFPGSNADMYAASYREYFPVIYKDSPDYDNRIYAVFRNVKIDGKNESRGE